MKNVLYIIWSLTQGGAERVVINLAKGLDKTRFRPVVCCLNEPGEYAGELESLGIKVISLNKKPKLDLGIIAKLSNVMADERIDIVHTHLWTASFWGRIAARIAHVSVVIVTEHNLDTWKGIFHRLSDRFLSLWTDKIIAVSQSVKRFYVEKIGISQGKIEVIYNGIEIDKFKSEIRNSKFDGPTTLAIIGRLVEQKGHRYLFEALSSLNGKYRVKLMVVGDGPIKDNLQSTVAALQLEDKVVFSGFRNDVSQILKSVDILVIPSLREGLPIIALEAMAAGVPVVATNVGGNSEVVIDGVTGLIVEPKNPSALANAISSLAQDRNYAFQLGVNGRRRVEDIFNLERMVRQTEAVYQACLG